MTTITTLDALRDTQMGATITVRDAVDTDQSLTRTDGGLRTQAGTVLPLDYFEGAIAAGRMTVGPRYSLHSSWRLGADDRYTVVGEPTDGDPRVYVLHVNRRGVITPLTYQQSVNLGTPLEEMPEEARQALGVGTTWVDLHRRVHRMEVEAAERSASVPLQEGDWFTWGSEVQWFRYVGMSDDNYMRYSHMCAYGSVTEDNGVERSVRASDVRWHRAGAATLPDAAREFDGTRTCTGNHSALERDAAATARTAALREFRDYADGEFDGESFTRSEFNDLLDHFNLPHLTGEEEDVEVTINVDGVYTLDYAEVERMISDGRAADVSDDVEVNFTWSTSVIRSVEEGTCACSTDIDRGTVERLLEENGIRYSSFDYEVECEND
jgi:hypothetical protein